jgi:hypothetical protein
VEIRERVAGGADRAAFPLLACPATVAEVDDGERQGQRGIDRGGGGEDGGKR